MEIGDVWRKQSIYVLYSISHLFLSRLVDEDKCESKTEEPQCKTQQYKDFSLSIGFDDNNL